MAQWVQSEHSRAIQARRNIARIPMLLEMAPTVFNFETYLYIGARDGRFNLSEYLRGKKLTILEAYDEYIIDLRKIEWISEIIHKDITQYKEDRQWDVVIWWHGPEHLDDEDLEPTIARIEKFAKHLVVLCGPWGFTKINTKHINPWEYHRATLQPKSFLKFGYHVKTLGQPNNHENQLCAVKTLTPICL